MKSEVGKSRFEASQGERLEPRAVCRVWGMEQGWGCGEETSCIGGTESSSGKELTRLLLLSGGTLERAGKSNPRQSSCAEQINKD